MKKMMGITMVAMACGAGLAAYALTNKDTKKQADKLLNTVMDEANTMVKKHK